MRLEGWSRAFRIFQEFPVSGSGLHTFGVAVLPLEAGARAYLPKPFRANDLHKIIERVLG